MPSSIPKNAPPSARADRLIAAPARRLAPPNRVDRRLIFIGISTWASGRQRSEAPRNREYVPISGPTRIISRQSRRLSRWESQVPAELLTAVRQMPQSRLSTVPIRPVETRFHNFNKVASLRIWGQELESLRACHLPLAELTPMTLGGSYLRSDPSRRISSDVV